MIPNILSDVLDAGDITYIANEARNPLPRAVLDRFCAFLQRCAVEYRLKVMLYPNIVNSQRVAQTQAALNTTIVEMAHYKTGCLHTGPSSLYKPATTLKELAWERRRAAILYATAHKAPPSHPTPSWSSTFCSALTRLCSCTATSSPPPEADSSSATLLSNQYG